MTSPYNPNLPPTYPQGPKRIVYLEAHRPPEPTDTKYRDGSFYEPNTEWRDISQSPPAVYKLAGVLSKTNAAWFQLNKGSIGPLLTLSDTNGTIVNPTDESTIPPGNIQLNAGPGVTITAQPGSNSFLISVSTGAFLWNVVSSGTNPNPMSVENGYITVDSISLVTLTLPASANVGDSITIVGFGSAGWQLLQNNGQTVHMEGLDTTTGVGGSISSTNRYDSIELVCVQANTDFVVVDSMGNLTIV